MFEYAIATATFLLQPTRALIEKRLYHIVYPKVAHMHEAIRHNFFSPANTLFGIMADIFESAEYIQELWTVCKADNFEKSDTV